MTGIAIRWQMVPSGPLAGPAACPVASSGLLCLTVRCHRAAWATRHGATVTNSSTTSGWDMLWLKAHSVQLTVELPRWKVACRVVAVLASALPSGRAAARHGQLGRSS
jgi:hypothetical protein